MTPEILEAVLGAGQVCSYIGAFTCGYIALVLS